MRWPLWKLSTVMGLCWPGAAPVIWWSRVGTAQLRVLTVSLDTSPQEWSLPKSRWPVYCVFSAVLCLSPGLWGCLNPGCEWEQKRRRKRDEVAGGEEGVHVSSGLSSHPAAGGSAPGLKPKRVGARRAGSLRGFTSGVWFLQHDFMTSGVRFLQHDFMT